MACIVIIVTANSTEETDMFSMSRTGYYQIEVGMMQTHGTRPFKEFFEPAVYVCESGFDIESDYIPALKHWYEVRDTIYRFV